MLRPLNPSSPDLVVMALRHSEQVISLRSAEWDCLVRQARSAGLLARIAASLDQLGVLGDVAEAPRAHLVSALTLARAQQDEVRREVAHVRRALDTLRVPIVLLKGAAYLLADHPAALGRTFSDLDVLVPKASLAEVEAALMLAGWATTHHSAYDQRYYRTWMHELPPMQHIHRETMLDVHHAILPETARLKPSSRKLLDAAVPIAGHAGLWTLAPTDMVLHSMVHLLHNEDLRHGLRDLSDLDLLLRRFGAHAGFWEQLVDRSRELDLARPLYYGLQQARAVLGTPVPDDAQEAARASAPAWPLRGVMRQLWSHAFRAPHRSTRRPLTAAALFALYVRAHWLRMPPGLLARHLLVKATTHRD